jgi:hypothetical protein
VRFCGGVRCCGGCSFGGGDVFVHRCGGFDPSVGGRRGSGIGGFGTALLHLAGFRSVERTVLLIKDTDRRAMGLGRSRVTHEPSRSSTEGTDDGLGPYRRARRRVAAMPPSAASGPHCSGDREASSLHGRSSRARSCADTGPTSASGIPGPRRERLAGWCAVAGDSGLASIRHAVHQLAMRCVRLPVPAGRLVLPANRRHGDIGIRPNRPGPNGTRTPELNAPSGAEALGEGVGGA